MRNLIATIVIFFCSPAFSSEEISGKFEQVELISQYMPSKELQELAVKKFQDEKLTLEFSDGTLDVYKEGDFHSPIEYRVEGNTIIAKQPEMDQYWILYIHDEDTIYSSALKFTRVEP